MKLDIDRDKIAKKSFEYGKKSAGFALKAGLIYTVLIFVTSFGFCLGAYHGIDYLGWAWYWRTLASTVGFFGGIVVGFYTAQMIVMGLIQDMLLDAGIEAGKMGYRAAMKKLNEKKAQEPAAIEKQSQRSDNK